MPSTEYCSLRSPVVVLHWILLYCKVQGVTLCLPMYLAHALACVFEWRREHKCFSCSPVSFLICVTNESLSLEAECSSPDFSVLHFVFLQLWHRAGGELRNCLPFVWEPDKQTAYILTYAFVSVPVAFTVLFRQTGRVGFVLLTIVAYEMFISCTKEVPTSSAFLLLDVHYELLILSQRMSL